MADPNKNIAVKPFIYDALVKRKKGKMTFTDVIEELLINDGYPELKKR